MKTSTRMQDEGIQCSSNPLRHKPATSFYCFFHLQKTCLTELSTLAPHIIYLFNRYLAISLNPSYEDKQWVPNAEWNGQSPGLISSGLISASHDPRGKSKMTKENHVTWHSSAYSDLPLASPKITYTLLEGAFALAIPHAGISCLAAHLLTLSESMSFSAETVSHWNLILPNPSLASALYLAHPQHSVQLAYLVICKSTSTRILVCFVHSCH